jgi:hypothetical protein
MAGPVNSRAFLEDNEVGYVPRVGCAFRAEVAPGVKIRADQLVTRFLRSASWQTFGGRLDR